VDWTLERLPPGGDPSLRAWSTADRYLLNHAREAGLVDHATRVLVVNDAFGALGVSLHAHRPQWWSDSFRSGRALRHNLVLNDLPDDAVTLVPGDEDPVGPFDLVLMRFPKSLAWQEDQLLRLRPLLAPSALVVAGGMIKHTPKRAFELLESCIGPTSTSLGWKKARLAFAQLDPELTCASGVPPKTIEVDGVSISARANVFAWDKLDLGARVLLRSLPESDEPWRIVDQGCGSGVLALTLANRCPNAIVTGVDESYQAIASAEANAATAGLTQQTRFAVNDRLDDVAEAGDADLVVCNPPFHQSHAVGDHVAWGMFRQAQRTLVRGGRYLVVGNRHMNYHAKLKRLFGNCTTVGNDKRFVVLEATRR